MNGCGGGGDGVWGGLYYWIQQKQVARGNQPWYYYLMLIPLYEQIGVVFGLIGVVRCIARPTRFRLFLAYWFVGNLFLYSWAAEKMPWLMIHITMPMLLLAAIGLEPAVVKCINLVKNLYVRLTSPEATMHLQDNNLPIQGYPQARPKVGLFAGGASIFAVIMAVVVLLPPAHHMDVVSYLHASAAPPHMMVYVQTPTPVNIFIAKAFTPD